jgi:phosphoadenosine phosphosulfate reductase
MLIKSSRHTEKDLKIWKEYEEMDQLNIEKIKNKEEKAVECLKNFVNENDCYIGISWGKDSITIADLALRNNIDIELIHLFCIPSHNYECDKVRDVFLKLYPNVRYKEIIVDYNNVYLLNLPESIQDKETDKLWYKAFNNLNKKHISGVRQEESGLRKMRMKRWGLTTKNTCCPIGYWRNKDVFAYLKKYDLPVHPNYAMLGNGRYRRENIRVAEIGDIKGRNMGRGEWEQEYYSNELNRLKAGVI